MKIFKTLILMVIMISTLAFSTLALDLNDVLTVRAKIDGDSIEEDAQNRVSFVRGDNVEVDVRLNSSINLSDVEVTAMISGYEFNDIEPLSKTSSIFDMDSDVTYKKELSLRVPVEVDEDNYKLRLIISDRYSGTAVYEYNLRLDSPRHGFQIEDVVFSPGTVVEAGRALLTTVRLENKGENTEDSVKVSVAIPELGISASDFIDEIEYEDSETSEEMYLRIPRCAEAGDYEAVIEVRYNELRDAVYGNAIISVVEGETCPSIEDEEGTPKTVIALGSTSQNVMVGGEGALYPLTVTNEGQSSTAYTVSVEGTSDFADITINPTNTFILEGEDSQAVYLYLTAQDEAEEGQRMFTVTVKSNGDVLKQIPLTAIVEAGETEEKDSVAGAMDLRTGLEIGLIVLVVLLIILAIVVGVKKMKKDEDDLGEDDEVEGKTYY